MGYELQSLLRIRLMREDRASGELTAARQAVARAQEALDARRQELEDYSKTRDERRDRIYAAVMGRPVTREQLDLAQEGVARIDEEGTIKADNVVRAQGDLKAREEAAAIAHGNFIAASKDRMKIDEHKAEWLIRDAKEQDARAEGELEDFTGRKQE
ncbi:MAG: YscO family type III secretion system apparatus protein [Kiritimatiellae bacterium]|nr:YscO family type III secretion system apparatus protein [Kiritimatiellia bacterium]